MYKGYKIVVNTAAGRTRYLRLLIPQVLSSDIVDRYDLWVNTLDKMDIAFFEALSHKYSKINLIWHPRKEINGIWGMNDFYKNCQEDKTIYIKLDDDVVWLSDNFFNEICEFRISNRHYFLVSPLVINNGISTYILQNEKKLEFNRYFTCQPYDLRFLNGYFAEELHRWFIENYLIPHRIEDIYCGIHNIALQHFAINAIVWFGEDFKKFDAKVEGWDEQFLTLSYPVTNNLINCFDCNTVIAHYSFSHQNEYLDKTCILKKYSEIIFAQSSCYQRELIREIDVMINELDARKQKILSNDLPYGYKKGEQKKGSNMIGSKIHCILNILRAPLLLKRTTKIVIPFLETYLYVLNPKRKYIK